VKIRVEKICQKSKISSNIQPLKPLTIIHFLKFLTCSVFFGRAWQHIFLDIPLRELMWRERWMTQPVKLLLGMEWEDFSTSMVVDAWLVRITVIAGLFYVCCAIATIFLNEHSRGLGRIILVGSFGLVLLSLLYWLEKFQSLGQFIEYSLQFGTPIFLVWAVFYPKKHLLLAMKIAIAFTFVGHGLYALGFYPVPAPFVQMTIDGFGMDETTAISFLQIIGITDIIVAGLIFIPIQWISQTALLYCIVWGSMTTFARMVANFDINIPIESCYQWLHEVVYRLPHGGVPLVVFLAVQKNRLSFF
jgi:hypothetical protein